MSSEQARYNMVEQQIRPWEVLDQRVLDLMSATPRDEYAPADYRDMAYMDMNIPIGKGHVMMQPKLEARLLQALEVKPTDTILQVGTGTGHLTSLLARMGKHVYSVDIEAEFTQAAQKRLESHGITNATLETGDGARGWDAHQPYDVIFLTGSLPVLPDSFRETLAIGGRMVAVVGEAPVMEARLIRRVGEASWTETSLFETDLPPLLNAITPSHFEF